VGQSAIEGLWHPFAYINGGGMNLEWFRSELTGSRLRDEAQHAGFDELNALAAQAPPTGIYPLFVPHLAGRVMPPQPTLRGAFVGLEWEQGTGALYRAMLEGVALEYGIYQKALNALDPGYRIEELRVTGGGEKSELWNRIKATVLGTPVRQVLGSGGAPMGSAMVAAYGIGLFSELPEAPRTWLDFGSSYEAFGELADLYRKKLDAYEQLLDTLNGFSREIADRYS
jgi:xylulokinase